eukprot:CAMPEP_0174925888 /NCGR_PEP_ID=MMETSP1355-20121228/8215_1 /TAXON_ID=464990 /ORGANISM="Hemiselmis tepida, Strain CCMP443" /LENGTH=163 /DNA_ID=CAMNT_0016171853 /DNA_START=30 /DNA_END=518 /DNA_ORIENTATION=-
MAPQRRLWWGGCVARPVEAGCDSDTHCWGGAVHVGAGIPDSPLSSGDVFAGETGLEGKGAAQRHAAASPRPMGRKWGPEILAVALAAFLAPCHGFVGGPLPLPLAANSAAGGALGGIPSLAGGGAPTALRRAGLGLAMGPAQGQGEERRVRGREALPAKGGRG